MTYKTGLSFFFRELNARIFEHGVTLRTYPVVATRPTRRH